MIVDARQAKAALSCRMNKTDVNDAEGLAQLARTGWYREVLAKRPAAQRARAVLVGRQLLVKQRRDLENQIRGVLRGFGLAVGTVARTRFEERVRDLLRQEVSLAAVLDALLLVRQSLNKAIKDLEGRIRGLARAVQRSLHEAVFGEMFDAAESISIACVVDILDVVCPE